MIPAWLSLLDAAIAAILVAGGMGGAHFELIPALYGLQMFLLGGLLGALAFLSGLIGIWRTRDPRLRHGRIAAWIGTMVGLAIAIPIAALAMRNRGFPILDDITTSFADPPTFTRAALIDENHDRSLVYDRAHCEPLQKAAYGAIAPLAVPDAPAIAFQHVRIAAGEMPDWRITYVDPERLALEGVATSGPFHFKQDFVIEVRPGDGGGSLIEMRSKSRDGISDFGVNATHIRALFAMLSGPPAPSAPLP